MMWYDPNHNADRIPDPNINVDRITFEKGEMKITIGRIINICIWLYIWLSAALAPAPDLKFNQFVEIDPIFLNPTTAEDIGVILGKALIPLLLWWLIDRHLRKRERRRLENKIKETHYDGTTSRRPIGLSEGQAVSGQGEQGPAADQDVAHGMPIPNSSSNRSSEFRVRYRIKARRSAGVSEAMSETLANTPPVEQAEGGIDPDHGAPGDASVPFMLTQGMKHRLRACGYSDEEIAHLAPQRAQEILARSQARSAELEGELAQFVADFNKAEPLIGEEPKYLEDTDGVGRHMPPQPAPAKPYSGWQQELLRFAILLVIVAAVVVAAVALAIVLP